MDFSTINWLAVFVASLSSFAIGAIWFGPKTFYPIWIKFQAVKPPEQTKMSGGQMFAMFGGTYLGAFIQVTTLAIVLSLASTIDPTFAAHHGGAQGAMAGALLGFGIAAASSLGHRVFSPATPKVANAYKVWLIEVGQDIVALTVAGIIIGVWV